MYTPDALLDAIVLELTRRKGQLLVSTWFDQAEALAIQDGKFVVATTSELFRDTLTQRFTENVAEIASELTGEEITPLYVCGEEAGQWRLGSGDSIFAGYTFDKFIVGNSNKFAHAAALAVANNPAALYNPLFIYGGAGLGKTHLLCAIAGHIRKTHANFRIVYITSEEFLNELVEALQTGFAPFHAKYRQADLLLVDDVQFLAGKQQMQEEFFHTFEAVQKAGKQIVLTSDRPPKEIATLSQRLISRFEMGLLADISSPDLETRMAMCKLKAQILGIALPQDVVEYVASSITENVRELEGVVRKIAALHSLMGREINMDLARDAIRDIFREKPGLHPTPQLILDEVSEFYNIPQERIKGTSRTRDVVIPRQVTEYLIREMTDLSLPDIGAFIGQHYTTVLYGINKLAQMISEDGELKAAVEDLQKNIRSR